jgi:tRNA(Ile)-lysidine synthase
MLKEFESHISSNSLFTKKDPLLLAISGGLDSVVLAHLLKKGGFNFSLAHCNFNLRGKDSLADDKFCKELAKKLKVKIFSNSFKTEEYAKEHKTTIQVAARNLRYKWFDELLAEHEFKYLLTAHHANDLMETMLINLLRGTGINGLKGIPEKTTHIVRPLLKFKRAELEKYTKENKIKFRTDKSNFEDKYERNFLRLNVIPLLKKLHPALENTFIKNSIHFNQEAGIVRQFLASRSIGMVQNQDNELRINKIRLKQEKYQESILNHLVGDFGFNETQQKNILQSVLNNAISGKMFTSPTHELTIDREDLIVREIKSKNQVETIIPSLKDLEKQKIVKIKRLKKFTPPQKGELLIDPLQLKFPLTWRTIKQGDKFKPFGMKGFKLISDFMKDRKMNSFEKENCQVLINGNGDILWVAGLQSDERYRVNPSSKNLLKLSLVGR